MASGVPAITLEAIPNQIITQVYRGKKTLYIRISQKTNAPLVYPFLG